MFVYHLFLPVFIYVYILSYFVNKLEIWWLYLSPIEMYADDTTLISTLEKFSNTNRASKIENNISNKIFEIKYWLYSNNIKFNASK